MRTVTVVALLLTLGTPLAAQQKERVDGFGGFFFRAKSPKTLAQWYSDHLGVTVTPSDYGQQPWTQDAGPRVSQPFPAATKYWSADKAFMLNFRVKNLD